MKIMHVIALLFVLLSFAVSYFAYPLLPEEMASHWGAGGEVNGYMPRDAATYLMPFVSLVLLALFIVLPIIDPLRKNYRMFQNEYDGLILVLIGFLFYLHLLTLGYNLGYSFNMTQLLVPAFAALFYYLGVLMGKAEQNWFVGIRTPWTMSSKRVWRKTHEIAGKMFKAAGIVSLIGIAYPSLGMMIAVGVVLAAAIFSVVYSYFEYRKEKKGGK